MKLSKMVQNQKLDTQEITLANKVQTSEEVSRGTAADVAEEELQFIKDLANPTPADETKVEDHIDPDVQAELDAIKSIAGI